MEFLTITFTSEIRTDTVKAICINIGNGRDLDAKNNSQHNNCSTGWGVNTTVQDTKY